MSISFIILLSMTVSLAMSAVGFVKKKRALKISGAALFLITLLVTIVIVFSTNTM